MRIRWTNYRLTPPSHVSELELTFAKLEPKAVRRDIWHRELPRIRENAFRMAGACAIIAILRLVSNRYESGLLAIVAFFVCFPVVVSFALSALSYGIYLPQVVLYWRRVITIARLHEEFVPFAAALRGRGMIA